MNNNTHFKAVLLLLTVFCFIFPRFPAYGANGKADFTVLDFVVKKDKFVYIKLQNKSKTGVRLSKALMEKNLFDDLYQ